MIKRIIVSIVALPLIILLMWLGGWWLAGFVAVVALLGQLEFYRAFGKLKPLHFLALVVGAGCVTLAIWVESVPIGAYTIAVLIFLVFSAPFFFARRNSVSVAVFGLAYVAGLISAVVVIRQHFGLELAWMIFIAAWGSDTGAYFIGRAFGKRKLAPKLSPGKTVAGSVGGIIASAVLVVAYSWILHALGVWVIHQPVLYSLYFAIYGLLGAVFAQGGDLAASALKRHVGIKDFGQLIPGHGGILDRFDSILFVAPFALVFFYIIT